MSPSPTENIGAPRTWVHAARRVWRQARGRAPKHVLYLQQEGLLSWRVDAADTAASVPGGYADFEAWCHANAGVEARVMVSGHLLHSLVVDPALRIDDEPELRRYAQQQFAHYHGAAARQWPLAVWSRGPHAGACAAPALDLAAMTTSAALHDIQLRSIAPVWSAGLASLTARVPAFAQPGACALALVEGKLVTWLVAEAGKIIGLQQRYLETARIESLAELLTQLIGASAPLAQAPAVVGWGLEGVERPGGLPAHGLATLVGDATRADWVLDRMMRSAPDTTAAGA